MESQREHLPALPARRRAAARLALDHESEAVHGWKPAQTRASPALARRCRAAHHHQRAARACARRGERLSTLVLGSDPHGSPETGHLSRPACRQRWPPPCRGGGRYAIRSADGATAPVSANLRRAERASRISWAESTSRNAACGILLMLEGSAR